MDDVMKLIGHRIKFLRLERGMHQTQLAELIGVSQTHLSNMESGRTGTTVANLLKLYKVLNCPISEFFVDFEGAVPEQKKEEPEVSLDDVIKIAKILKTMKSQNL